MRRNQVWIVTLATVSLALLISLVKGFALASPIDGAFGFRLGEVFDPSTAISTSDTKAGLTYEVSAPMPSPDFDSYRVSVVRESKAIYQIFGRKKYDSLDACKLRMEPLAQTLRNGHSFEVSDHSSGTHQINIGPDSPSGRSILLTCSSTNLFDPRTNAKRTEHSMAIFFSDRRLASAAPENQMALLSECSAMNIDAEKLKKLASNGDPSAQCVLGSLFERGEFGLAKDDKRAAYWYAQAADLGNGQASFNVGRLFFEGRGVRQDTLAAWDAFNKAGQISPKAGCQVFGYVRNLARSSPDAMFVEGLSYASGICIAAEPSVGSVLISSAGKSYIQSGNLDMAEACVEVLTRLSAVEPVARHLKQQVQDSLYSARRESAQKRMKPGNTNQRQ